MWLHYGMEIWILLHWITQQHLYHFDLISHSNRQVVASVNAAHIKAPWLMLCRLVFLTVLN